MAVGSVSAAKTVKVGKYKIKLSNKEIKKIKKGKHITKSTGKYFKYRDYFTKKIKKVRVKISVGKWANDGATKKGRYYAEAWSSAGPISSRWVKL